MIAPETKTPQELALPQTYADRSQLVLQPAPCLLRAEGLIKAFGGQVVLDGVGLEIRQGEVILLRGENGSGKTTLLNILTGNLEPDSGAIHYQADGTPRRYEFPRRWWQDLNPFDHFTPEFVAREGMGRTWQDVRLFGAQTLRDNIAVGKNSHPGENPLLALFAPGLADRREAEIRAEVDAMLARLGLEGRESSSADKISLGQSKRVAIARAVAAGAKVLFLDEPLAGLDRQGITDVLTLLESLVRNSSVTLVIVEHVFNQAHLRGLITTDWLLTDGRLTASKASSLPGVEEQPAAPSRPEWFDLLAGPGAEVIEEPLPRGGLLARIRRPGIFQEPPKPVLEIRDLVVQRGGRTVIGLNDEGEVAGFDLTLYEGEITILQAPNGWGKSTFLYAAAGLIPTITGTVSLHEDNLAGEATWRRRQKGLLALPSERNCFATLTVGETGLLGRTRNRRHPEPTGLSSRMCSSLSGGEEQALVLSNCLTVSGPRDVLLLDEPVKALDRATTEEFITLVSTSPATAVLMMMPSPSQVVGSTLFQS